MKEVALGLRSPCFLDPVIVVKGSSNDPNPADGGVVRPHLTSH